MSISKKEMLATAEKLLEKNKDERKDYLKKYDELVHEMTFEGNMDQKYDDKKCPRCGAELILRTAKKGENAGKKFYGCSEFPKCRYTLNI